LRNNPTNKQDNLVRNWLKVVKHFELIHKWELVDKLHINVGTYNQNSSYMKVRLEPMGIIYEDGFWKYRPQVEEKEIMQHAKNSMIDNKELLKILGKKGKGL